MKSIVNLLASVVVARNSYTIPFEKQSLSMTFAIPLENVTGKVEQLQDCNLVADQSILMSCANGWHAVD
tara:strand:- start:1787 stop:1993 length:207 start_codon:yes stop_codon:yes gene_type:complete